jgi:MraZ protein
MIEATRNDLPQLPEPVFAGGYERAVDGKGRFNLPFRFRRRGGKARDKSAGREAGPQERYTIVRGPDAVLLVYPYDVWLEVFDQLSRDAQTPQERDQVRRLSHGSHTLELDAQGRIAVPQEFLSHAGLSGRVLCIGMRRLMELWDPERYRRKQEAAPVLDPRTEARLYA